MSNNSVSVSLPPEITRDIVQAHIKAAVVAALATNQEALVRAVVDAAMAEKKNSYDRATIWDELVNRAIRDAAQSAFQEWIAANMPMVRKAVHARLDKDKRGILDKVVNSIADAAKSAWCFQISFKDLPQ